MGVARPASIRLLGWVLLVAGSFPVAAGVGGEDPRASIVVQSRESEAGPVLELRRAGEPPLVLEARADALLLSYLAERVGGSDVELTIDRRDQNRAVLFFDVEADSAFEAAELVLHVAPSRFVPGEPFPLAARALEGPFEEPRACWANQPGLAENVAARVDLDFRADASPRTVRMDVTELVRAWSTGSRPNHGVALLTAVPVFVPPRAADVEAELIGLYAWEADLATGVERSRASGKPLLVLVVAADSGEGLTEHERYFLATALSDPPLAEAIRSRFLVARVPIVPARYTFEATGEGDPVAALNALGLRATEAPPPSLVVFDPEADATRVLARPAALHAGSLAQFLEVQRALDDDDAAAERDYVRLARRSGEEALWELARLVDEAPDSPWALKSRVRQTFPGLVRGFESYEAPAPLASEAEIEAAATAYLLGAQLPDGSFTMGTTEYEPHRQGVVALCAHALLLRGEVEASARATAWLAERVAGTDPAELNSFTAAYFLDLQLERHARGLAERAEVDAAIATLCAGQLEDGAWSYSRMFGEGWRGGFSGWPKTERGRSHSINTGIALDVLTRARALGLEPQDGPDGEPSDVLARGGEALLAMRVEPAVYTYTFPEPRNFEALRASVARGPVAELALLRLGSAKKKDLRAALDAFEAGRGDLDIVRKLTDAWVPPQVLSGYFHACAYYHAARAARELSPRHALLARIRSDLFARVDDDGTWMDTLGLGRPYATAMALLTIAATRP